MLYTPPIQDIQNIMNGVAHFTKHAQNQLFTEIEPDLVRSILEEAGRFAQEKINPISQIGDQQKCLYDPKTQSVKMPDGWKEVYQQWCEAGWAALPCPKEWGGQNLPIIIAIAVQEMFNAAAPAFGIGVLLTQAAATAIDQHAKPEIKKIYLPKLVSGQWMGTMNLTEPQAGSDLSLVKTTATPQSDGTYLLSGTKIYITHGDHDLTENIIHLVLARTPNAPQGTKGLSLFLVPKYIPQKNGAENYKNDVTCLGIEDKLGLHASPTCVMQYGQNQGAKAWIIGEENQGLKAMFTMMNLARLQVGVQGVATAEAAAQHAIQYAKERKQGKQSGENETVPIIKHPDVKRMIMNMRAQITAARAICYALAESLDIIQFSQNKDARIYHKNRARILTPIAKAFPTDMAVDTTSIALQIHGGAGYIEQTGAAQYLRDARITPVYEGTNGIQAIDLVMRALPIDNGKPYQNLITEIYDISIKLNEQKNSYLAHTPRILSQSIEAMRDAGDKMMLYLQENQNAARAAATQFLTLCALTIGAAWALKTASETLNQNQNNQIKNQQDKNNILWEARYFAQTYLPHVVTIKNIICGNAPESLLQIPDNFFMQNQ